MSPIKTIEQIKTMAWFSIFIIFDSPPLECWCLFSARFTLSRVGIFQRDCVFRYVPPGFQLLFPIFRGTTLQRGTVSFLI